MHQLLETLGKYAQVADEKGETQQEALTVLRRSGHLGCMVPEKYGGLGFDSFYANRLIESIAMVDPSMAIIAFQHLSVISRILEWGTEKQKQLYLPLLASGEWMAASAWSESGAGAGKQNLSTVGTFDGGRWSISGAKTFTTGAGLADLYLVLVQTGESNKDSVYGSSGQTFFLIETTQGITANSNLNLAGMRGSSTGFIELLQCSVPADQMLGALGSAPKVINGIRECGLTLGAVSVGIAQAAYQLAKEHIHKRKLAENKLIQYQLAELHMLIEAARSIVDKVASRTAHDLKILAYQSKIFASEISEKVCREAQQLLGGTGYMRGQAIERLCRDARAVALMGPVNQLAREIVGSELLS
jgi:alkylation response protein AidB-like acyl-CoA dehydrogenase